MTFLGLGSRTQPSLSTVVTVVEWMGRSKRYPVTNSSSHDLYKGYVVNSQWSIFLGPNTYLQKTWNFGILFNFANMKKNGSKIPPIFVDGVRFPFHFMKREQKNTPPLFDWRGWYICWIYMFNICLVYMFYICFNICLIFWWCVWRVGVFVSQPTSILRRIVISHSQQLLMLF